MRAKFPVLVLSALLLASCASTPATTPSGGDSGGEVVTAEVVSISASGLTKTVYEINEQVSLNGLVVTAYLNNGTSKTVAHSECQFDIPSTATSGMKNATVTYSNKSATFSFYVKQASSTDTDDPSGGDDDPSGGETDLDGFVAIAEAPEGATRETFTDWTDAMKTIFTTYLAGVIPPFFYMDELRVTYDNLDILQVRGKTRENVMADYYIFLNNMADGYQAIMQEDSAGRIHVYGRTVVNNVLVSIDALEGTEYVTINFDKDVATSSWPAEGLKQVFSEEYESIYTIPAYEAAGVTYIIEEDIMSNLNILCLGAPETSVETYKQALLDSGNFEVQQLESGEWTAQSRDKRIIVLFYYDGYGLMICTTHGEGENYASWSDCVSAINEFGRKELRLNKDIAETFPEITSDQPAQYSINREVRGILKIVIHKESTFKQEDLFKYAMKCYKELDYEIEMKDDYYWLVPADKSFALYLVLTDYVSDLGETWSDITVGVCDYRIFEGYYVYYGVWPTAMVNTIVGKLNPSLQYPGIEAAAGVYYVKSNYKDNIFMDILNLPESALADYKNELKNTYEYTFTDVENGYVAVDPDQTVAITCTYHNGVFHWDLSKYTAPVEDNGLAEFNFLNNTQYVGHADDWSTATWACGKVSFVIGKGTSSRYPTNQGQFIGSKDPSDNTFYPVALFNGQTINISHEAKKVTKIELYANDDMTYSKMSLSFDNLKALSFTGATREVNEARRKVTFTFDTPVAVATASVGSTGFTLKTLNVYYE